MNPIKAFYCRTVQAVLRAALPVLPYREPEIFRSCGELSTVFAEKNILPSGGGSRGCAPRKAGKLRPCCTCFFIQIKEDYPYARQNYC